MRFCFVFATFILICNFAFGDTAENLKVAVKELRKAKTTAYNRDFMTSFESALMYKKEPRKAFDHLDKISASDLRLANKVILAASIFDRNNKASWAKEYCAKHWQEAIDRLLPQGKDIWKEGQDSISPHLRQIMVAKLVYAAKIAGAKNEVIAKASNIVFGSLLSIPDNEINRPEMALYNLVIANENCLDRCNGFLVTYAKSDTEIGDRLKYQDQFVLPFLIFATQDKPIQLEPMPFLYPTGVSQPDLEKMAIALSQTKNATCVEGVKRIVLGLKEELSAKASQSSCSVLFDTVLSLWPLDPQIAPEAISALDKFEANVKISQAKEEEKLQSIAAIHCYRAVISFHCLGQKLPVSFCDDLVQAKRLKIQPVINVIALAANKDPNLAQKLMLCSEKMIGLNQIQLRVHLLQSVGKDKKEEWQDAIIKNFLDDDETSESLISVFRLADEDTVQKIATKIVQNLRDEKGDGIIGSDDIFTFMLIYLCAAYCSPID
ncbi:MAG: hypothetical protein NTW50_01770 [Candidatus Berkelbacteria bacterium]|nr:hypothetical protein [Candidatus Berkelbacteria bacterium]